MSGSRFSSFILHPSSLLLPMGQITLDTTQFRQALVRLIHETGRSAAEVLGDEGRLTGQLLMRITPPKTQKQGRERIAKDMGRSYSLFLGVKTTAEIRDPSIRQAAETGDYAALRNIADDIPIASLYTPERFSAPTHDASRNRQGRVQRPQRRSTADYAARKADLAKRQRDVGIAKSGWAVAVLRLGGRAAGWITRHGSRFGRLIDRRDAPNPSITLENTSPWANRGEADRAVQFAMNSRARSITSKLDRELRQKARRIGFLVK